MTGLILVSHGSFAAGIREAAEMILGEQDDLVVLGLYPGDTVDVFSDKLEKAIDTFPPGRQLLVMTDIPSGTPANTANRMVLKRGIRYLSGLNLSMLLEVLACRCDEGLDDLVRLALEAARDSIVDSNELLKRLDG